MNNITYKNLSSIDSLKVNPIDIAPYQLSIGITPKCNSKCSYCVNWRDKKSKVWDYEEIIDIINGAKNLGITQVLFSGGEPLLYPERKNVISYTKSIGLDFMIITNGLLLDKQAIDFLHLHSCKKIGISLDTISPQKYAIIRGVPIYPIINNLKVIKENYKASLYNNISICCTVHRYNVDDLDELLNFCIDENLPIQFQPLQIDSNAPENTYEKMWPVDSQLSKLEIFFEGVLKLKKSGARILNTDQYIMNIFKYFKNRKYIPQCCYAPFAQITIDQSGGLRPCWAMSPVSKISTGADLEKAWFSDEMKAMRDVAKNHLCNGCYYSCHLSKLYNIL